MRGRYAAPIALGIAVIFGLAGCGSGTTDTASAGGSMPFHSSMTPSPTPSATPTPTPTPTPTATGDPSPAPTSSPSSPSAFPTPSPSTTPSKPAHVGLQLGDKGPQVVALQKKLQAMGFWLTSTDGSYGQTTEQAVLAFQKAAGLGRDGVAGPLTLKAVDQGVTVQAKTTTGHWLEIDKARQLLIIATDGKVEEIMNTSTGSNQPYTQGGATYVATTPSGEFSIFRQVDGDDPGPLGDLWRPKYFNGGIAVHGAPFIPGYPASHGCARLSNAAIDWIWSTNQAPIGTKVLVY